MIIICDDALWICRVCDTLISVYKWPHNQRARQTQKWIRTHTHTNAHTHVVRDLKFIVCSASNTLTLALLFWLNLSTRHQKKKPKKKKNKIPKPTKRRDMTRNLWDTVRLGFFCPSVRLSVCPVAAHAQSRVPKTKEFRSWNRNETETGTTAQKQTNRKKQER